MPGAIQIPKFDTPASLPDAAINAPDSPMTAKPDFATPQPNPAKTDGNFLDAVRESNNKRAGSDPAPKVEEPVTPAIPKSLHDTTPKVFKDQAEPKDTDSADLEADIDDFVDPTTAEPTLEKSDKPKNIKELKTHLKTARARETQLRTRNEELAADNARLLAFEEKIEEHERLLERVAQLETYEKIFDIHSNPEFQAKYIEGDATARKTAKDIAKQYNIQDESVIDQAVKIRNRADLTNFLKSQGLDEFGITDIRPYILHLQSLEDERIQLEKTPEQARDILGKMFRESEARRLSEVTQAIKERSTTAWNQILGHYSKGETAIDMLKTKPGDPDHAERRSAVLGRANDEYTKVMNVFAELGIKDMPQAVAHALAARFQLSEVTGEFVAENKALKQQVAELTAQLEDTTSYTRPGFKGSSKTPNGLDPEAPKGTDIAGHVFNKARDAVNSRAAK